MSQPNYSENQVMRDRDLVISVAVNMAQRHFENATTAMDDLAHSLAVTIEQGEPLEQSFSQYILSCVAKIELVCRELTASLQIYNNGDTVNPNGLLRRLTGSAKLLNFFLVHGYPEQCLPRITIQYVNRPVNPYIKVLLERQPNLKFLKNIVLVHDESVVSCDCPICYETVQATGSIYTNCNHGFCVTCIKDLVTSVGKSTEEKKPVCPMCRIEIIDLKIGGLEVFNEVQNHLSTLSMIPII